jgi:ATP synthase protein I
MNDPKMRKKTESEAGMEKSVAEKEARRLIARREGDRSMLFGLSIFGIIGWSLVVPTLLGVAIGVWIDGRWPGRFSWTLMLLFGGLFCGCLNAWYWVSQVSKND